MKKPKADSGPTVQGYRKEIKCVCAMFWVQTSCANHDQYFHIKSTLGIGLCEDVFLVRKQGFFLFEISVTFHSGVLRDGAEAAN